MERIYTYYNEQQLNLEEAKKYAASALEKLPAFVELVKFIYDGSLGLDVDIKEQSIDDAFDCIINRNKAFIKTYNLSNQDKENRIHQIEGGVNFMKVALKNSLKQTSL